jgi:hypothetical protein
MHKNIKLGVFVALTAVALSAVPTAAGAASLPKPRHFWAAEGNANDATGLDNGTLEGNVGYGPGVFGTDQAFSFPGGAGLNDVMFNTAGGSFATYDFSVVFDIRTTATHQEAVWEKRPNCNTQVFWGSRTTNGGSIDFEMLNLKSQHYYDALNGTTPVNDGTWHQVAVTRQGGTVSLYVDGTMEDSVTTATPVGVANQVAMRAGYSACQGVDGTQPFTGSLDELTIYRIALTPAQVALSASQIGK